MIARVVGIGQPAAGDDGVGIAVVSRIREMKVPEDTEVLAVAEPSGLVPLLDGADRVVVVDAVLAAGAPGRVLVLAPEEVEAGRLSLLSTHGVDVTTAIALARSLSSTVAPEIAIVGITIGRAEPYRLELSPEVARAVPVAAAEALRLAGGRES